MNLRIAIPLSMVASFSLSFALLRWDERSTNPVPAATVVVVHEPRVAARPTVKEPIAANLNGAAAVSTRMPTDAESGASNRSPPVDPAEPPLLPVQLSLRSNLKTHVYYGSVANSSSNVIKFELVIFDPESGQDQRLPIILGPSEVRKIGQDDDISMRPGDTVSLHAASFRDVVNQLPRGPG